MLKGDTEAQADLSLPERGPAEGRDGDAIAVNEGTLRLHEIAKAVEIGIRATAPCQTPQSPYLKYVDGQINLAQTIVAMEINAAVLTAPKQLEALVRVHRFTGA